VDKADRLAPRWNREQLEHMQARGLVADPARVRAPQEEGRVESGVKFAQRGFFAGEKFAGLADGQRRVGHWRRVRAGMRARGATRQRPAEVFARLEAPALLPVQQVSVRADGTLVKIYRRGQVIRAHPRAARGRAGQRPGDFPPGAGVYARRDVGKLARMAAARGEAIGPTPRGSWTPRCRRRRRGVHADRPGPRPRRRRRRVSEARFARDPREFATATGIRMQVLPGGPRRRRPRRGPGLHAREKGQPLMTTTTTGPPAAAGPADGAGAETCRYPGCANPARVKDPAAPGPRPGHCGQDPCLCRSRTSRSATATRC
jgi:hypothetical protein